MLFTDIPFNIWTLVVAALLAVPGVFALAAPSKFATCAALFPRDKTCGRVLSALAFLWAGAILYFYPFDFVVGIRKLVPVIFIAAIPLSWIWLERLLSARAFGGLLALLPAPVLLVSRSCDSQWRLVAVVLMYVYAVAGMAFILYPYLVRDAADWLVRGTKRIKAFGAVSVVLAVALALLAVLVY